MSTDRDSSSPFSHLRNHHSDARTRLEEFERRFDERLKSHQFPTRSMFEHSTQNPPSQQDNQTWTSSTGNSNVNNPNNQPTNHPNDHQDSNMFDTIMNDARFPFHDAPSFFRQRFNDRFGSHRDQYFPAESDHADQSGHRVHHIPIHIEPRSTAGTGTSPVQTHGPTSRENSPMPQQNSPMTARRYQPEQHPNIRNVPINQQQPPNVPSQPTAVNEYFTKSASPRNVSVPIQVTKSPTSPSSNEKAQMNNQTKEHPINESTSDPTLADPNKVYVMSYDPKHDPGEAENKLPEVVPLAYEPPTISKQSNSVNQPSEKNNGNVKIVHAQTDPTQAQQPDQPPKQETPFDYVDEIMDDLKNWEQQVHECQATDPEDKGYKWLDEMLTLCVLRLDCIDIDGNEELRKYRKQAINEVNRVVGMLESKIKNKKQTNEGKPTEPSEDDQQQPRTTEDSATDSKDSKKKDKKDGKRFLFFKKKNTSDTDRNNNDLKSDVANDVEESVSSQNQSAIILPGRETEV